MQYCACAGQNKMAAPIKGSRASAMERDDGVLRPAAEEGSIRAAEGAAERAGEGEGGGSGDEEEEDDSGVREQMRDFFSELDLDLSRQKRNLMTEGLRVRDLPCKNTVHSHCPTVPAGSTSQEPPTSPPSLGDGVGQPETGSRRLGRSH